MQDCHAQISNKRQLNVKTLAYYYYYFYDEMDQNPLN